MLFHRERIDADTVIAMYGKSREALFAKQPMEDNAPSSLAVASGPGACPEQEEMRRTQPLASVGLWMSDWIATYGRYRWPPDARFRQTSDKSGDRAQGNSCS
jgi:hypothetical protein